MVYRDRLPTTGDRDVQTRLRRRGACLYSDRNQRLTLIASHRGSNGSHPTEMRRKPSGTSSPQRAALVMFQANKALTVRHQRNCKRVRCLTYQFHFHCMKNISNAASVMIFNLKHNSICIVEIDVDWKCTLHFCCIKNFLNVVGPVNLDD